MHKYVDKCMYTYAYYMCMYIFSTTNEASNVGYVTSGRTETVT